MSTDPRLPGIRNDVNSVLLYGGFIVIPSRGTNSHSRLEGLWIQSFDAGWQHWRHSV